MSGRQSLRIRIEGLLPSTSSFVHLCEQCDGAWPATILEALQGMDGDAAARRLASDAREPATRKARQDRRLPLPHPIDADWRFTREGAEHILDLLLSSTPGSQAILLVGMPSVALAAADRGFGHRIVIASRRGDPVDAALRSCLPRCGFVPLHQVKDHRFAAIALDPPWYDDVAIPLIETVRPAASGRVFVCIPDLLTMPTSAPRLAALPSDPEALGFRSAVETARIRYATPFFEVRCLEALGIANVSPHWRTGRLFTCVPRLNRMSPPMPAKRPSEPWREATWGPIRIWSRSRSRLDSATAARIDVATSVSRSDPTRAAAELWTSGNTFGAGIPGLRSDVVERALAAPTARHWSEALRCALESELNAVHARLELA